MVEDSNLPKTPRPIVSKKIPYFGGMTYLLHWGAHIYYHTDDLGKLVIQVTMGREIRNIFFIGEQLFWCSLLNLLLPWC